MSIPPRVVDHTARRPLSFRLPHDGLRAIGAGVEAAAIGWVVLMVCAIAAYVATASEAALGSASWLDAAQVGTNIWLLAHGGVIQFSDSALTVIPWGIALIAVILVRATVRRSHVDSPWSLLWVGAGYLAVQAVAIAVGGRNSWAALLGSVLIAAVGAFWGIKKEWPWHQKASAHMPSFISAGLRAGNWVTLALILGGTILTVGSLIAHSSEAREVHQALAADPVSSAMLVAAQILLVGPVLMGWALSFFSGVGFSVGEGTIFSPEAIESGPLPALPILAALPAEVPASIGTTLVISLLIAGVAGGLWVHRHRFALLAAVGAVIVMVAFTGLVVGVIVAASSGSIGPGTMAVTGASGVAVAWNISWKILLGGIVTVVAAHPSTHAAIRGAKNWLGVWWREMRGTNQHSAEQS